MEPREAGNGELIARYRRRPATCVYCGSTDLTNEHPVGQAIGGRLHAPILCHSHNNEIGNVVDSPYFKRFAPVVAFLGVPRQDGQTGTSFGATFDDGSAARVKIDGIIPSRGIESKIINDQGKITHAKGDLKTLDRIKAAGAMANDSGPVIAIVEKPPIINFEIAADALAETIALKTALHFVAGFVCDIDPKVAADLLPFVLGKQRAAPQFVRTISFGDDLFERSWPPRHEVTVYPAGNVTYVTVMHFGLHSYVVRLPFRVALTTGLRYRQILGESEPQIVDGLRVPEIDWERDLIPADLAGFQEYAKQWNQQLMEAAGRRDVRERIRRAVEQVENNKKIVTDLSYVDRLRAELQLVLFTPEQVERIIQHAEHRKDGDKPLWELAEQIEIRQEPM
jgi:hypothetical protein